MMFLCVFKNTDQKKICASIVFKTESKLKHEEKFLFVSFLQKPKTHFFGGPKWSFLKVKFQIVLLHLLFNVKGSFMPIFTKKYNFFGPLEFFENEKFDVRARQKFGFAFLKSYLTFWLVDLF